jgi:hypothetical protein
MSGISDNFRPSILTPSHARNDSSFLSAQDMIAGKIDSF